MFVAARSPVILRSARPRSPWRASGGPVGRAAYLDAQGIHASRPAGERPPAVTTPRMIRRPSRLRIRVGGKRPPPFRPLLRFGCAAACLPVLQSLGRRFPNSPLLPRQPHSPPRPRKPARRCPSLLGLARGSRNRKPLLWLVVCQCRPDLLGLRADLGDYGRPFTAHLRV